MTRTLCAALAMTLATSGTNLACPDGNFDCYLCSTAPVMSAGTAGLTCPTPPGGLPVPPTCTKWVATSTPLCLGVSHNCTGRYICCPDGHTGYFACNKAVLPDCTEQLYCHSFCCPDSSTARIAAVWVECNGPFGQMSAVEYVALCN